MNHHYTNQTFVQGFQSSSFWTILSGVLVFVLGQIVLELIIKPLKEYKIIKSHLTSELKYYTNIICNPISENYKNMNNEDNLQHYKNVSHTLRRLSCDLEAKYYDNSSFVRKWMIKDDVKSAGAELLLLSNRLISTSGSQDSNHDIIIKIKKYLDLN